MTAPRPVIYNDGGTAATRRRMTPEAEQRLRTARAQAFKGWKQPMTTCFCGTSVSPSRLDQHIDQQHLLVPMETIVERERALYASTDQGSA